MSVDAFVYAEVPPCRETEDGRFEVAGRVGTAHQKRNAMTFSTKRANIHLKNKEND